MTSPTTGELVSRATYMVGNPSAWDNYDEEASAVIDQLVAALVAADEGEKLNAEFIAVDDSRITTLERELEEARALNNKYAWERDKAREERDAAERRSEAYWKPQVTASQAEVERLRAALKPFADAADAEDEVGREHEDDDRVWIVQAFGCLLAELCVEDLHNARAALEQSP